MQITRSVRSVLRILKKDTVKIGVRFLYFIVRRQGYVNTIVEEVEEAEYE